MKEKLRNLIADGKTAKAISQLRLIGASLDDELREEILIQSNRFNKLIEDKNKELITSNDQNVRLNSINVSLLSIINQLPDNSSISIKPVISRKNLFYPIFIGLFLVTIVFFYFEYANSGSPSSSEGSTKSSDTIKKDSIVLTEKPDSNKIETPSTSSSMVPAISTEIQITTDETALVVHSNFDRYQSFFERQASKILNNLQIDHQRVNNEHAFQTVEFSFELNETPYDDEAFIYELNLAVEVTGLGGKICFADNYASKIRKLGYSDDSKNTMIRKTITPLLKEVEESIYQTPPTFCKALIN